MSNLFDAFSKQQTTEPPPPLVDDDSSLDSDDGESEEVLARQSANVVELEALKAFTIPKARKRKDVFEAVDVAGRSFKDIQTILERSLKNRDKTVYKYTKCFLVHNEEFLKDYSEKKKIMREGKESQAFHESYAFLLFNGDRDAREVCQCGVKVKNSEIKCLGNPELGVYLCKHADVLSPTGLSRGFKGSLVIFKVIKGKVKSMVENWTGEPLDPTPNFDCHVSKSAATSDAFESSQLYLYEYDEFYDIVDRPRQILPYALVHFTVTRDQYRQRGAAAAAAAGTKPTPKTSATGRPISTTSPSSTPFLNQMIASQPQRSQPPPPLMGNSTNIQPLMQDGTPPPQTKKPVSSTPSPYKHMIDSALSRIGKPPEEGAEGIVVWTGNLTNNAVPLCEVDMVAYGGGAVKPALLSHQLSINKTVSWNTILTLVLNNVVSLSRDAETRAADHYYSCYCLKATPGYSDMFRALVQHLNKKQRGAYVNLEDSKALLLPTCDITNQFKLTVLPDSADSLHCIVISPRPREQQLKGRLGMKSTNGMAFYSSNSTEQEEDKTTAPGDSEFCKDASSLGILSGLHDPPKPSRQARLKALMSFPDRDFLYEGGFKGLVPSTCRLTKHTLYLEFNRQIDEQDKFNIECAKRARIKRTLSSQSSRESQSNDGLSTKSGSRLSSSIESLKNQPLFADFPVSDNTARDPRVSRQISDKIAKRSSMDIERTSSSAKLDNSIPSSRDIASRVGHVTVPRDDNSQSSDSFNNSSSFSLKHNELGSKPTAADNIPSYAPMKPPPVPPMFQNTPPSGTVSPSSLPNYFQSTNQRSPVTPPLVSGSPHTSQASSEQTTPQRKVLLPTPPDVKRIQGSSLPSTTTSYSHNAEPSSHAANDSASPCQNLAQGPSVGRPPQMQPSIIQDKARPANSNTPTTGPAEGQTNEPSSSKPIIHQRIDTAKPETSLKNDATKPQSSHHSNTLKTHTPQRPETTNKPSTPLKTESTNKPKPHTPHKSLITSLPLPPGAGEELGLNIKRLPDSTSKDKVVEKDRKRARANSGSSSSSEEENTLTDDVVNDIIKMRPVSSILNRSTPSRPKDEKEAPPPEKKVAKEKPKEKPKEKKEKPPPPPPKIIPLEPEFETEPEKTARVKYAEPSPSPLRSKQSLKTIVSSSSKKDEEKRHRDKTEKSKEKSKSSKRERSKSGDSRDREKKKARKDDHKNKRSKILVSKKSTYRHLIRPCSVKIYRLSKTEIRFWRKKRRSGSDKRSKRCLNMLDALPSKSRAISETDSFFKELLKNETSSKDRKKIAKMEKEKKEKMKNIVKIVSSSFSGVDKSKQEHHKSSKHSDRYKDRSHSSYSHKSSSKTDKQLYKIPKMPNVSFKASQGGVDASKSAPQSSIPETPDKDGEPTFGDVIDSVVSTALHRKAEAKACRVPEAEVANWRCFWSVALHYLLPLLRIAASGEKETAVGEEELAENKTGSQTTKTLSSRFSDVDKASNDAKTKKSALDENENFKGSAMSGSISKMASKTTEEKQIKTKTEVEQAKSDSHSHKKDGGKTKHESRSKSREDHKSKSHSRSKSEGSTLKHKDDIKLKLGSHSKSSHSKSPKNLDKKSVDDLTLKDRVKDDSKKLTQKDTKNKQKLETKQKTDTKTEEKATAGKLAETKKSAEPRAKPGHSRSHTVGHAVTKRPALRKGSKYMREMIIYAKKSVKEYQELPCMTHSRFFPRLEQFKARAHSLLGKPRFLDVQFTRSSLADVAEHRRHGNKEEVEEYEFSKTDIRNFEDHVRASRQEEEDAIREQRAAAARRDANANLQSATKEVKELQKQVKSSQSTGQKKP